jgi:amidase
MAKVDDDVRAAVDEVAGVLRSLGHDVRERDPDHVDLRPLFIPRWAHGIHEDAGRMARREALEPRTRQVAALGRALGERAVRWALAKEEGYRARMNALFDDHDVLLTPTIPHAPHEAGYYVRAGVVRSINRASRTVVFAGQWNVTGQPAVSVPAPTWPDGVPRAVQIVGRPNDEATLLSVAAQLEAETGWPDRTPPVG